jgi:signal transduction histidine kinase
MDTPTMTIQGSGAGFDPHEAMRGPGLGLTSMKERLKVVGGQMPLCDARWRVCKE